MIKKFLYLLVILTLAISGTFAGNDPKYDYVLKINQNLDEDETLTCYITEDGSRDREKFDDKDRSDDFTFEGRFDDEIKVDCDTQVEDIRIQILDLDGNEVYDERFQNTKQANYKLELYEARFELNHVFDNDDIITCKLKFDEQEEEFTYSKANDGSSMNEDIKKEFLNEVSLDCDDKIDEFNLKVYEPLGERVYYTLTEEEDSLDYDTTFPDQVFELEFYIVDDFNDYEDNDVLSCDFTSDSDSQRTFEYDDSSKLSEKNRILTFAEKIKMDCDDKLEEITMVLTKRVDYDDVEFYTKVFTNEDRITLDGEDLFKEYEDALKAKEEALKAKEEALKQKEEPVTIKKDPVVTPTVEVTDSVDNNNSLNSNTNNNTSSTNASSEAVVEEKVPQPPKKLGQTEVIFFLIIVGLILAVAITILVLKKKK